MLFRSIEGELQMSSMSNYLENKLTDFLFRGGSFTAPSTLAIALCTSAPTDASTGATLPEVSHTNGYERALLAPSTANWAATDAAGSTANPSAGTGGTTSNNTAISFPALTGSWGTITHVAILDSGTYGAGNVLFWGALTSSITPVTGNVPVFNTGTLTHQIDN